jgi:hypothetical protein
VVSWQGSRRGSTRRRARCLQKKAGANRSRRCHCTGTIQRQQRALLVRPQQLLKSGGRWSGRHTTHGSEHGYGGAGGSRIQQFFRRIGLWTRRSRVPTGRASSENGSTINPLARVTSRGFLGGFALLCLPWTCVKATRRTRERRDLETFTGGSELARICGPCFALFWSWSVGLSCVVPC